MKQPKRNRSNPKSSLRRRLKPCDRCQNLVDIRYRIKYEENGDWQLVCPPCWHQVQPDNPYYQYGGTWKARLR